MSPAIPLRLHVPEPKHRPGDSSDFADMQFLPAGALPRPASDTPEAALREFPYGLIRVLDEHGKAIGEWAPTLSAATLYKGLRAMMLTRAFDERMQRAQRQGKAMFYIKSTGEEAVSVPQALALDDSDLLFPGYGQPGLLIERAWSIL